MRSGKRDRGLPERVLPGPGPATAFVGDGGKRHLDGRMSPPGKRGRCVWLAEHRRRIVPLSSSSQMTRQPT